MELQLVKVLGTNYIIEVKKDEEDDALIENDAYCDRHAKRIVLSDLKKEKGTTKNLEEVKRNLLRHEIIHAFMYESGLDVCSPWGTDESLVDWIALQFPKMLAVFEDVEAI